MATKEIQPEWSTPVESDIHSHSGSNQAKIDVLQVRKISGSQVITGKVSSNSGSTYFDLNNDLIVMNDGTTNRLGIGNFDNLP